MKVLVTGVGGQLGHDVMNELAKRAYEGVGSDIAPTYSGIADGSMATKMPYVQMDITDADAVSKTIESVHPDVVIHCAAWTAVLPIRVIFSTISGICPPQTLRTVLAPRH